MRTPDNDIVDILEGEEEKPRWCVPGLLAAGQFMAMIGESGAGKSYLTYVQGLSVAAGLSSLSGWIGKPDEPKTVLYFDDENSVIDRNKYLRRVWNGQLVAHKVKRDTERHAELLDNLNRNFRAFSFVLGNDEWPETLERYVEQFEPDLVVFDTANSCFAIENENDNAEAIGAIRTVKRILQSLDKAAAALALKHQKTFHAHDKGDVRQMRGAKVWKDASDSTVFMIKSTGRKRVDGLVRTRLEPDKVRAFGLGQTIYITPSWTDSLKTGLLLEGSDKMPKGIKMVEVTEDDNE